MQNSNKKSDDVLLDESAKQFVDDFSKLLNNELSLTRQDFNFYTKVNHEASKKIDKISDIISSNEQSIEVIDQSYAELEEYKKYIEEIESTLDSLELTINQLDEQTKMIESSFRSVERKLAQQAINKKNNN